MQSITLALVSGLIGALITSAVNLIILWIKEDNETKATIKAIKSEIKNLEYIFGEEFGKKITDDEQPLFYKYPLDTDYFYIYHSNCSKIGRINNDKLRDTIISIYTTAKFFIDCLKSNNEAIKFSEEIEKKYENALPGVEFTEKYKEDMASVNYCLYNSKVCNLLPTYKKLCALFEQLKSIK